MDFNPSAYSVSLATAQSSLNLYHLNLKCCSSFAYLPLIIEPVAMAKYLNLLCRSSSPNTPEMAACVHFFCSHTTKNSFISVSLKINFPNTGIAPLYFLIQLSRGGISHFPAHTFLKERRLFVCYLIRGASRLPKALTVFREEVHSAY